MKAVFFEANSEDQKTLKKLLSHLDLELKFSPDKLTSETALKAQGAEIVSVFVNSVVDKKVIQALPKLRLIATRSTGTDHIDKSFAQKKGIEIANVPKYGATTVAEFTFGLILTLSRKIYQAYHNLREKGSFELSGLQGFNLQGKTLGVIGTGNIGKNVIKIAKGFEMQILAYDVYPNQEFAVEWDFQYVKLEKLLKNSDIITLHVPYLKATHHLLNRNNFANIKPEAYLINTSRGAVVETDALIEAIKQRRLAGAALDVLEGEKDLKEEIEILADPTKHQEDFRLLVQDHLLIDLPNVIVTPHLAFNTKEAVQEILETTAHNIQNFLESAA